MHSFKIIYSAIFILIIAAPLNSLIAQLTDLNTMAKQSDIVAYGYVGDQKVVNDDLGRLITLTDIEVIDGLYGAKTGEVITVYQVGGQKNGVVMPMLGGHHYQLGQEVILFGLKLGHTYVSYGAGQGKLDVVQQHGEESVVEDLGDIGTITNNSQGKAQVVRPTPLSFSNKQLILNEIKEMLQSR